MKAIVYISVLVFFLTFEKGSSVRVGMILSRQNEPLFLKYVELGYQMAINDSNFNDSTIEPLEIFHELNDVCDGISGSRAALDFVFNHSIQVIFGSICSENCMATAQITSYWNIPYYPMDCFDSTLDDSNIYSTISRIFGSLTGFGSAFQTFFYRNDWKVTSIVTESNSDFCTFGVEAIRNNFRKNSIKVTEFYEFSYELNDEEIKAMLNQLKNSARVIILCHTNYDFVRKLIYMASDIGMTNPNNYAWITFYNIYGQFSFNMLFYPWEKDINISKTLEMRKKAFQAVKIITYSNFTALPQTTTGKSGDIRDRSLLMIFLADAVNLFMRLRSKAFMQGFDYTLGNVLMNQSKHVEFEGITETVKFNEDADRLMTYTVWSLTPAGPSFKEFLKINMTRHNYTAFLIGEEYWGKNVNPPPDIPKCGFDDICATDRDDKALTVGLSVSVIFTIVAISLAFLVSSWWCEPDFIQ